MPLNEHGLTQKQERFCLEYVANRFNGVKAAESAGYKGDYNTLGVIAAENLRKLKISARIQGLTKEYIKDKKRLGRDVIGELLILGTRRISDIIDENGDIKSFEEMGDSEAAISGIKITKGIGKRLGKKEITLESKTKPLEILLKYSGLIEEELTMKHKFSDIDLKKLSKKQLEKYYNLIAEFEKDIKENVAE